MIILILILLFFSVPLVLGVRDGIKDGLKGVNKFKPTNQETNKDIPDYVYNKLNILETQKTINNDIIKELENNLQYTVKTMEVLKLEKKINDLDIKNNKIDQEKEKIYKKWGL